MSNPKQSKKRLYIGMLIASAVIILSVYVSSTILGSDDDFYKGTEVTVYNQGMGLVKQDFTTELNKGINHVLIEGVASQIDTSSVKLNGDIELLEQNYQYDLVNREQMMQKFIGKELTVMLSDPREEISGKLLSYSNNQAIIERDDGTINILSVNDFILPKMDTSELLLKPTLNWMIDSPRSDVFDLSMMYTTWGMDWSADYILELNALDTAGDLKAWVTVENNAGTTFKDAQLKLIAGDVNVIQDRYSYSDISHEYQEAPSSTEGSGFAEEGMFEYHMYTLDRPTTLKNKEEKQISLLETDEIGVEKRFVYSGSGEKVYVKIIFENSLENNMGMPLPAGKVKVFKEDSSSSLQFVGEDTIDHTPKDKKIELSIGEAFDIRVEKKQTDYQEGHRWRQYSYDVLVKNHKEEDAVVFVEQPTSGWSEWSIISESLSHVKDSQKKIYWEVPVEKEGEETLSYTLKYTYSW